MGKPAVPVLRASEWEVHNVPDHGTVERLVRAWHYSRSVPNTSTYRHGLHPAGDVLAGDPWGVTLWLPPIRAAAEAIVRPGEPWTGVLTLSRLAVDPSLPQNAASFLMARSMRLIDRDRWPVLVTYADTRLGHTGAIYKATNWTCEGEVPAGDMWLDAYGRQRGRKRGRFTYTRDQMIERGYTPAPAGAKIRFTHRVAG